MSARELWQVLERARQNEMQVTLSSVGGGKDNPIIDGIEVRTRKPLAKETATDQAISWYQTLYVIDIDTIQHAYLDVVAAVIEAQVEQILEATGGPDHSAGRVSWQSASYAAELAEQADHGRSERAREGLRGLPQRADSDRGTVLLQAGTESLQSRQQDRARAVAKHLAAMEKADPEVYKRCDGGSVFLGAMNQIIHMARTVPDYTMMYNNLQIMLTVDRELYEAMMDAKPPFAFHWNQICLLARDG